MEAGLGIENMDMDEFNAMFEDEGEEVVGTQAGIGHSEGQDVDAPMPVDSNDRSPAQERAESFDLFDDSGTQFGPTQGDESSKGFKPLFDD